MLRARIANVLEPTGEPSRAARVVNWLLFGLIAANLVALVLESVDSVHAAAPEAFRWFELGSLALFAGEYALRLWCCTAVPGYEGPIRGRLRFAFTPLALIDLLAILPLVVPAFGIDLRSGRVMRLFRLFRIAKLARYSRSLRLFARVFQQRRAELVTVCLFVGTLLLLASSLMYYVEHDAQPEAFSSIPATFWWAVATLTTVGYGDVYPVTELGKVLAGIICLLGIGMIALPTSILGASFVRELGVGPRRCPHCDHELKE
jgi:voltage-gated potassium channel